MTLFDRVTNWGYKVGIFKESTLEAQTKKLMEECQEFCEAVGKSDTKEGAYLYQNWPEYLNMTEELGDIQVVVCVLAHMLGTTPDECLLTEINKIEQRRGKMVDGLFVKNKEA